jgi:hypothetical protein
VSELEERIPTHIWVSAQIRTAFQNGSPTMVLHKGEPNSGIVLVKISLLNGNCRLLIQQRNLDGVLGWMPVSAKQPMPESEADDYIRRSLDRDPDIWAIESENPEGKNPFEGPEYPGL